MEEKAFFKVNNNKFWILEQWSNRKDASKSKKKEDDALKQKKTPLQQEDGKEKDNKVNAWVFNNEIDAIKKLKELITQEGKIDLDNIDEMGEKFNFQEVEITPDKYNMKAISWLKVALLGFAEK